jgi:hypothetical protein
MYLHYGVDLIADCVRATITLRFSPTFGQNSSYGKVQDIKIKLILIKLQSYKVLSSRFLFNLIIAY